MHIPVLLRESLAAIDPRPGEFFVDGTFGGGGFSEAILRRVGVSGTVLAVDADPRAIVSGAAMTHAHPNLVLREGNYADVQTILDEAGMGPAHGIVIDLGFSSSQLAGSGRGFSFSAAAAGEPLLMTYSDREPPVRELLRGMSEAELRHVIRAFGEERFAGRIARAIADAVRRKPIETAGELADIVRGAVPKSYGYVKRRGARRIDPATRTFQALRIYANRELENLERILGDLPRVLRPDGRAAFISFHSLEDRIVKTHFRALEAAGVFELITRKPITASAEEVSANPRSRSAKLRAGRMHHIV